MAACSTRAAGGDACCWLPQETVLSTIVTKATLLSGTEAGAIYVFDEKSQEFRLHATYGMDDTIVAEIKDRQIRRSETAIGKAVEQRMPVQIPDVQDDSKSSVLDVIVRAGFRALLIVPLLGADRTVGALVVRRPENSRNTPLIYFRRSLRSQCWPFRMHVCLKMLKPARENWRSH
jgi:signal transduction protein with GAF and PtsI domain